MDRGFSTYLYLHVFFQGNIQDCGAKTDALGEWQGSTKFGGERLGAGFFQRSVGEAPSRDES
jgi:hypothetical protein